MCKVVQAFDGTQRSHQAEEFNGDDGNEEVASCSGEFFLVLLGEENEGEFVAGWMLVSGGSILCQLGVGVL